VIPNKLLCGGRNAGVLNLFTFFTQQHDWLGWQKTSLQSERSGADGVTPRSAPDIVRDQPVGPEERGCRTFVKTVVSTVIKSVDDHD